MGCGNSKDNGSAAKTEAKDNGPAKTEAKTEAPANIPKSRLAVIKAVSAFRAGLDKDKEIEEDDVVCETMKTCPEHHLEEVLDMCEDSNGKYTAESLDEGAKKYEANLADIVLQVTAIKKAKETKENAMTKLMAVSAFKEGAACKSANAVQKKSIKMRSLGLIAELAAEVKVGDAEADDEKAEKEMKEAIYANQKAVADELLKEYLDCEKAIQELITSEDKKSELRALWKKCDNNGSKKLSTTEFNSFARSEYPLFVQPRANKFAFKLTCQGGDGDEWVNRKEFALLLKNMAFLNKVYFLFDDVDSSDDAKVSKEEFASFVKRMFPIMTEEKTAEIGKMIVEKADSSGNGQMGFREFVTFILEWEAGQCGVLDTLKPIEDDEE